MALSVRRAFDPGLAETAGMKKHCPICGALPGVACFDGHKPERKTGGMMVRNFNGTPTKAPTHAARLRLGVGEELRK